MWRQTTHRETYCIFLIAVYCICLTASLAPFYLDWHNLLYTMSTTAQQLGTDYIGCVTLLVMIGKSICPSCQKEGDRLEYYCTSEIYRGISLLSASTVDSINGFYIVYIFCRVAPRSGTRVRGWVLPGDEPAKVESGKFQRTSMCVDAPYK